VDLNPTAVQLARVALWIESVAGDRPLTYFEHHVRCGNSLLGTWMERLRVPLLPALSRQASAAQAGLFEKLVRDAVAEAVRVRRLIDDAAPEDLRREGIDPDTVEEQGFKERQRRRAEETLATAKLLFDLRSASAFVPEIWTDWNTLCGLVGSPGELRRHIATRPWSETFESVRERDKFFHWELEFPEVLLKTEKPGFDAVLGNPPWDKVKPDKKEFYGRHDVLIRAFVGGELDRRIADLHAARPGLDEEFRAYELRVKTLAACLKKAGDYRFQDWEIDGKGTGGDPDVFKFFVERAHRVAGEGGRVGFVVPSAIYNNEGCTGLRHLVLDMAAVERFYGFENRRKIFPIDSRYKFVSLVFRKGRPGAGDPSAHGEAGPEGFEAAFMRHDLEELQATARQREPGREKVVAGPAPWVVTIRRSELERLSPGTLAFLEYRSPRDREILLKMYGYDADGNPVNPRPLLGDQGPGTWNARFYREFDMTNDRDLWTDPRTGRLWNPRQILGPVPGTTDRSPFYDPAAWLEIRARMAEKSFWPLYQDAHIHQFTDNFKPFMRWLSLDAHERKYHGPPESREKLVFRDKARCTDERSIIAAVLPTNSACGHTLNGIALSGNLHALCWLLNSVAFDFLSRFRIGGQHASPYLLRPIVVLADGSLRDPGSALLHDARCEETMPYDDSKLIRRLAEANLIVAKGYQLEPADFEHILSSFPVFARKRPAFFAYLRERLAEWAEEVGRRTGVTTYTAAEVRSRAVQVAEPREKADGA
jgi:hypothetical protein